MIRYSCGVQSINIQTKKTEEEMYGFCCACNYEGTEETPCPKMADGIHCVHWWEGKEEDRI